MTNQDILRLQEKLDSGFYPKKSIDKFQHVVDASMESERFIITDQPHVVKRMVSH